MRYLMALMALVLLVSSTSAQAPSALSAENATWEVHVHLQKLFASPIGGIINEIIQKEAPDGKLHIDAFVEAMGFDPRTDVGEVVIFGDDFEHTSATAIADIGSNRGNLEGWLLAAPGYQSEKIADGTILHSLVTEHEDGARLWCALPMRKANGGYVLIAGFNAEKVRSLVDEVMQQETDQLTTQLTGNNFLALDVNDLSKAPIEIDEDEPGSAIIKTLQSISLTAAAEENQLSTTCEITTDDPTRAQQLNQLIAGMKAMVQLALPQKHPEAEQAAKWLNNLSVEYTAGESTLSTRFSMDYAAIEELIELKHKHKHH
jgi:hypothetical protein